MCKDSGTNDIWIPAFVGMTDRCYSDFTVVSYIIHLREHIFIERQDITKKSLQKEYFSIE